LGWACVRTVGLLGEVDEALHVDLSRKVGTDDPVAAAVGGGYVVDAADQVALTVDNDRCDAWLREAGIE